MSTLSSISSMISSHPRMLNNETGISGRSPVPHRGPTKGKPIKEVTGSLPIN